MHDDQTNETGSGVIESERVVMNEPSDGVFPSDHFGIVVDVRV